MLVGIGVLDGQVRDLFKQIVSHGIDRVLRQLGGHHAHEIVEHGRHQKQHTHSDEVGQHTARVPLASLIIGAPKMHLVTGLDGNACLLCLLQQLSADDLTALGVVIDRLDGINGIALQQGAAKLDARDQQGDHQQGDQDIAAAADVLGQTDQGFLFVLGLFAVDTAHIVASSATGAAGAKGDLRALVAHTALIHLPHPLSPSGRHRFRDTYRSFSSIHRERHRP